MVDLVDNDWPDIIRPMDIMFHPENPSRQGGASADGSEQVATSENGRWKATVVLAKITTREQILTWRGLLARMQGRVGALLVPAFDGLRVGWPLHPLTEEILHPGVTRDPFLDDTLYEHAEIPSESEVNAVTVGDAELRDTEIVISVTQGQPLEIGNYFGIGVRLYLIADIEEDGTLIFWPPLREDVAGGTTVKITRPVCRMNFADDDTGRLLLERLRHASVTIELTEAF